MYELMELPPSFLGMSHMRSADWAVTLLTFRLVTGSGRSEKGQFRNLTEDTEEID